MSEAGTLDPKIGDYLERAVDVLVTAGSIAIERHSVRALGDSRARLRTSLRFPRGSYLEVGMTVGILGDTPMVLFYSFQYMTAGGTTIFRYDNSEHHRGLPNFPHHKHEGADERVVGCPQPSISLIRDEVAAHLKGLN